MAQIKNTFLKGKMNQDLDSRIVPNGEYREAINLQISRSESDTVGEFENVLGNVELFDTGGSKKIIGYVTNESENIIYVFATDYDSAAGVRATAAANMGIYRYDVDANDLTTLVSFSGLFLAGTVLFRLCLWFDFDLDWLFLCAGLFCFAYI